MPAELEIRDGDPHSWLSPDVWTVPGDDPLGVAGQPVAGRPCYLWARVHNIGDGEAVDAQVNFYIGNPAVGVDRATAVHIGTSSVTINAGEEADVLCLAPWAAAFLNNGHVCAIAEALVEGTPAPGLAFDAPRDPRVAQRNLAVAIASTVQLSGGANDGGAEFFLYEFEVHNGSRKQRQIVLEVAEGSESDLEPLAATLGIELGRHKLAKQIQRLGLVTNVGTRCPSPRDLRVHREGAKTMIDAGERKRFAVLGELTERPALMHISQWLADEPSSTPVGGLSVLILPAEIGDAPDRPRARARRAR